MKKVYIVCKREKESLTDFAIIAVYESKKAASYFCEFMSLRSKFVYFVETFYLM